jgi:hypothetical protein
MIYGWHDNELYAYNVVVDNDLTIKGTLTFGDAATDNLIIKGRMSSMTAAGSAIQITSSYAYGEGIEMRYQVTDWTGIGSSFKGMYLRSEAKTTAATGKSIYGAEIYGVCNNVTMTTGSLWGALFYAYVKGVGAVTVNNMYAVQGELTWDASRTHDCTITTAAACFRAKITGGHVADYTKIHGYELTIGEMDGDSAKFGKGLFMQDDSGMGGTCTLTTGIDITIGCTTGISIGNSTTGISIGDCVKGIEIGTFGSPVTVQNSDWDTAGGAYTITKAMISGCLNEDLSDSQCVRQLWSRFKITASQTAGSGKDYYGGEMQVRPHTGSAAIELAGGTYAGVWNYWENSDSAHALTVSGGYHYGSINMVELCSTGVISGGTFAAANMTNHVDTDPASATLFDAILINKVSGAYDWKIGVDVNDCITGIQIGNCTTAGITVSGTAATAQIQVAGTAILTSGEQAIYVNCPSETVATNGVWITLKSTVTSGDLTGGRFISESLRETSGGPNVRAVYGQARCKTASKYAALLQGGLFVADYNGGSATVTNMYGVTGFISQGSGLTTSGNVAAVQAHLQTRSDETIGVHTGVLIHNEAVGGNGLCLAQGAIYITESSLGGSVKGYDCLIDASTATMTVHDTDRTTLMKFKDSGGTVRKLVFDPTNNTVVAVQT